MKIINIIDEDFVNYKITSMNILFPYCSLKCDKEANKSICQNSPLLKERLLDIPIEKIVNRYINNPISKAIVCIGMEPFDSWEDLQKLISTFREKTYDDIVIYTGYNKDEILDYVNYLTNFSNIIIKFGRYKLNEVSHYDNVLGVNLSSSNQYAEKIS